MRHTGWICVVSGFVLSACVHAGYHPLWAFALPYKPESITATDAEYSVSPGAMTIRTGHEKPWPGVTLTPKNAWDLSAFQRVSLDVENLSDEMLRVYLRIDDPQADGKTHCLTGSVEIAPGQTETVSVPLYATPWVLSKPLELVGMRGYPKAQDELDVS